MTANDPLDKESLAKLLGVYPVNNLVTIIFECLEHNGYEIRKKEDTSNPLRAGKDVISTGI